MSFLVLAVAVAMVGGAADAPAPATKRAGDLEIRQALLDEYAANPDRKVCIQRTFTGSRQPRAVCGPLRSFWAMRPAREVAAGDPPWELVEQIKENRRKVTAKARAAN